MRNTPEEEDILGFLGGNVRIEDINQRSRIILIARRFDPSLFSMGEWLSSHDVAFRCIEYTPMEISTDLFISFSIVFDRSPITLYPLTFISKLRLPGYFWHNIGLPDDKWWNHLIENGQISTGFENQPGDQGERILKNYIYGDIIISYATGHGAIGWGKIDSSDPILLKPGSRLDFREGIHLHRRGINWKTVIPKMQNGIKPDIIYSEYGIYHPVSTSVSITDEKAKRLIKALDDKCKTHSAH